MTSLLSPFMSHAVGTEAVAILFSGLTLDADAKTMLMQLEKVPLVVDMLNEGAADTKINRVRLIRILMYEGGFQPETVASLSLLVSVMCLIRDKRHPDGVVAELLNFICAVHRSARSMIFRLVRFHSWWNCCWS